MKYPVIFIGPMCCGKSTIAAKLSEKLNVQNVPMDDIRWYYYFKNGFSFIEQKKCKDFSEIVKYWKPFELKAIEMAVKDFPNSIIDFGAGHSHFTDNNQLEKAQNILEVYENVILLLPCENKEKSVEILNKRFKELIKEEQNREPKESEYLVNREFVYSESNWRIAKKIIYTENKTPIEVTDEVAEFIL